ncbi:MAG: phosphomethylpyrimidine synthase ThiC [Candidatus Odinarchaeia archaeon]
MGTLMQQAKEGNITPLMKQIASDEGLSARKLVKLIAEGKVIILNNAVRNNVKPVGVGELLRTKVNANIGTSSDIVDYEVELVKARTAIKYGADTIMDLSTGGDIDGLRRKLISELDVPIGTVPIYQAAIEAIEKKGAIVDMDEDIIFNSIHKHLKDGIDFITVHVAVTKEIVSHLKENPRLMGMVSRGGVFHAAYILHNDAENPLYSNFDYLLEIAKEFDATLSLGDGLRPGCIYDATDWPQIQELLTISKLVKRAWAENVQVMVEGPGHIPLNQIETNMRLQKTLCEGAPFYVLGPLVTDIAPGYDHIVAAIGGALAGFYGADFLCYVTPSEHLGLPNEQEVREGVIASKIAAHTVDLAKGRRDALMKDFEMAKARAVLDWHKEFKLALDPEKAEGIYKSRKSVDETCTMCGKYCALKILADYMGKKESKYFKC